MSADLIAALVTAFGDDGSLDLDSTRTLFSWAAGLDVEASLVAGTTGEFVALSDDERMEVLALALEEIGPQRVFAHVGAASTHQASDLAGRAQALGATRFAAITPFYTHVPHAALDAYYRRLRSELDGAELFAYVFPDRTGLHIEPEDLAAMVLDIGLDGVKVSIPGVDYVRRLSVACPGMRVYSGNDGLFPEVVQTGGSGVVSGVMQTGPQPFVDQSKALQTGNDGAASQLRDAIGAKVSQYGSSLPEIKRALVAAGLIRTATVRVPAHP